MSAPVAFIGDVHGWLDRLDAVVAQLAEELVLMGDLVDRGPESAGVVARVRAWTAAGRARCLMGNHEYATVRALGCSELGIRADEDLFRSWYEFYGGEATAASYGVHEPDPAAIRAAMGDDLPWLAELPWVLTGGSAPGPQWVACHAGLDERPLGEQLAELAEPRAWFDSLAPMPADLYAKDRIGRRPCDAPPELWIVCGHVPREEVLVRDHCIACDTSGGRYGRRLSAVRWPSLAVVTS